MVAWTCEVCDGSGKREQIVITGADVEKKEITCDACKGNGFQSNR